MITQCAGERIGDAVEDPKCEEGCADTRGSESRRADVAREVQHPLEEEPCQGHHSELAAAKQQQAWDVHDTQRSRVVPKCGTGSAINGG